MYATFLATTIVRTSREPSEPATTEDPRTLRDRIAMVLTCEGVLWFVSPFLLVKLIVTR